MDFDRAVKCELVHLRDSRSLSRCEVSGAMFVPKLTIVTIHLNDFKGLQRTLQSLMLILGREDVEWCVVDGASDWQGGDTFEQVKSLTDCFISEPDKGIYDAMNKGTSLATGDYVLYLNAGDELHPDFQYDRFTDALFRSNAGMVWGRYDVRDHNETVYSRKTRRPAWLRYGTAVCHQAVFFKRSVLGSRPYDTELVIAADYDLICRLYTGGERIEMLDMPVCVFDLVGESGADKWQTLREVSSVRKKYFPIAGIFSGIIAVFKYLMWQTGTVFPAFRRAWSRVF